MPKKTDPKKLAMQMAKGVTAAEEKKIKENADKRNKRFAGAMKKLPDRAPARVEIEWVRNHPAMSRLERDPMRTAESRIYLSAADVNGYAGRYRVAPSKGAVHMLQHWCNRPEEFWRNVLSEDKKRLSGKGAEEDQHQDPPEIKDIDEFLQSIAYAVEQ